MSSKTKYWSSFVAVNCTSLKTSLSTIRSIFITLFFRNSQCSISYTRTRLQSLRCATWENSTRNLHNCYCRVRSSKANILKAWAFVPFSKYADKVEHVSVVVPFCTVPASCAPSGVTVPRIESSIRTNFSPAVQCGRTPTSVGSHHPAFVALWV